MKRTLPFAWARAPKPPAPAHPRPLSPRPDPAEIARPDVDAPVLLRPIAPPQLDVVAPERIRRPAPAPLPPLSIDAPADLLEVISFVRSVDPVKVRGLHLSKAEVIRSPEAFLRSHLSALEAAPFTAAALTFYRRAARLREILKAANEVPRVS